MFRKEKLDREIVKGTSKLQELAAPLYTVLNIHSSSLNNPNHRSSFWIPTARAVKQPGVHRGAATPAPANRISELFFIPVHHFPFARPIP